MNEYLLWTQQPITERAKVAVYGINFRPSDLKFGVGGMTMEQIEQNGGVFVNFIPEPENNGKPYNHFINLDTMEQWYEYYDLPKSNEELLQERVDFLENAVLELGDIIAQLTSDRTKEVSE